MTVKEIWDNQSFVSSQMDGMLSQLVALVQRIDGRGEERSDLYCSSTHARYLYIKSVMLCGTVQL